MKNILNKPFLISIIIIEVLICIIGISCTSSPSFKGGDREYEYGILAPTNVHAEFDNFDFSVKVTWDAVSHAENYMVYRSDNISSGFVQMVNGVVSTSWTDSNPLLGSNYYVVYAVRDGQRSEASLPSNTVNYPLAAPTNVKAEVIENRIRLSWSEVRNAESYDVLRQRQEDDVDFWEYVGKSVNTTTWTDKYPYIGQAFYRVQAIGHGMRSEASAFAIVRYSPLLPAIVSRTVNGVTFRMLRIRGGTFEMGNTDKSYASTGSEPAHDVTLSDYEIGETEVTQELWTAVMGSNPSFFKGANLPVENVSWEECQEFIKKLNSNSHGYKYRLPTEAEWEYAARGGNRSKGYKYSGSNTIGDVAWYMDNSDDKTHPVATKSPNELGIYDMSGNVAEWCQDWFDKYYYSSSPKTNPTGPSSGTSRVIRGGFFYFDDLWARVVCRMSDKPTYGGRNNGLRLAGSYDQ